MRSPKRSVLLLGGLIFWVVVVYVGIHAFRGNASEDVALAKQTIDLGEVCQGDLKKATFVIENRGSYAVHLTSATTSCSCIAARFSTLFLKPAERANLPITLNTAGKLGDFQSLVRVNWEISGTSRRGNLTAVALAKAVRMAVAIPKTLDVGSVDSDNGAFDSMIEIRHGESTVQWSDLEASSEKGGKLRASEDQRDWRVHYVFNPTDRAAGPFRDDVAIRLISSSGRSEGVMHVPVIGQLDAKIAVVPRSIMVSTVAQNQLCEGDVMLQPSTAGPLSFLEARCDDADLQFSGRCLPAPDGLRFHYTFKAPNEFGALVSKVRLSVKTDKVRVIAVPLLGFVKDATAQQAPAGTLNH